MSVGGMEFCVHSLSVGGDGQGRPSWLSPILRPFSGHCWRCLESMVVEVVEDKTRDSPLGQGELAAHRIRKAPAGPDGSPAFSIVVVGISSGLKQATPERRESGCSARQQLRSHNDHLLLEEQNNPQFTRRANQKTNAFDGSPHTS